MQNFPCIACQVVCLRRYQIVFTHSLSNGGDTCHALKVVESKLSNRALGHVRLA